MPVVINVPFGTPLLSEQLTSEQEIINVFSTDGVANHLENLNNYGVHMNEVINRASAKVLLYLRGMFDIQAMVSNVWVREKATYIACYLISIRSGNPSLYGAMYEESLIELAQVRAGQLNPGLPRDAQIVMQTPMLDNRGYRPGLRTVPEASTSIEKAKNLPIRYFNRGY
jgi:hypothetical protein